MMEEIEGGAMKSNLVKLVVSILGCELAGILGGFFTQASVTTWYPALEKPSFTPPSWLFGPVWVFLYLLMGISFYLVWNSQVRTQLKTVALILFLVQLGLNILWSFLFFYLKNPLLGFIEILILLVFIILTAITFHPINKTAAYLFIPYILWVGFASILNLSIWKLNG